MFSQGKRLTSGLADSELNKGLQVGELGAAFLGRAVFHLPADSATLSMPQLHRPTKGAGPAHSPAPAAGHGGRHANKDSSEA